MKIRILLTALLASQLSFAAEEKLHDIVVYGGASGGTIASKPIVSAWSSPMCRRTASPSKSPMDTMRPTTKSFRAIVPKNGECENLLVPWSLSASHMAFGSIRMEPVFMILAQSAVIAADLCLDHDLSVQALEYEQLRPALIAAGQVLDVE